MSIVCETIKDLIPLYLDGTSSNITNKFVKRHLKRCRDCSEYCNMCRHSKELAEKRMKENSGNKDLIYIPDDGYELIAERVSKSILIERIALASAIIATIATVLLIFRIKMKKDK